jgi:hypothetical protein
MPNEKNLEALAAVIETHLGYIELVPGEPKVPPLEPVTADPITLASEMASQGALMTETLTDAQVGQILQVARNHRGQKVGPGEVKALLSRIARGE